MKRFFLSFTILLFIICTSVYSNDDNDTIVKVNGHPITREEVNFELARLEEQAMIIGEQKRIPLNYADVEKLREHVIATLINKLLLLEECDERSITVTPELISQQLQLLKNRFQSQQDYQEFLSYSDISEKKLNDEIRISLRIDALATELANIKDSMSPKEINRAKLNALNSMLTELHKQAEIIWVE
jgi:FKBP-type peptidyl-prolyl cis-trans isomerase (trigger factor)